jgi:hypothetical protein
VKRRAWVGQLARFGRPLLGLGRAQRGDPLLPRGDHTRGAGLERAAARRQRSVELRRDRSRVIARGFGDIDHDHLGVGAEHRPEAEPEVERHPDHERDVGPAERYPARA